MWGLLGCLVVSSSLVTEPLGGSSPGKPWLTELFPSQSSVEARFQPHCDAVEVLSLDPLLVLMHGFLDASQCAAIIRDADAAGFQGSTVGSEQTTENTIRTSTTAWLRPCEPQSAEAIAALDLIDQKIAAITAQPLDHGESLQVVRYEEGQHYKYHLDTIREYNEFPCGGRLSSTLLYLNDDFEGGETHFLELDVRIAPTQGSALFWYNAALPFNAGEDGAGVATLEPNLQTVHAGLPLTQGVKYVANKWVHPALYRKR